MYIDIEIYRDPLKDTSRVVGLIFKLVVRDLLLLSRFSMDKEYYIPN